jgi:cold shock protein
LFPKGTIERASARGILIVVTRETRQEGPTVSLGVVEWFNAEEGWGALAAPEVPGGCFVHYSNIQQDGYRVLTSGQRVRFNFEEPGFLQDGYPYRAIAVWPIT